jgi:hypothetical protein
VTEREFVDRVVDAIERDLGDRRGMNWDEIDPVTQRDIRKEWRRKIQSCLDVYLDSMELE